VDSGASKHMTGYKDYLSNLTHKDSPHKVKLGYDYQYPIKGVGEASNKLESRKSNEDEGSSLCSCIEEEPSLDFKIG
jgi:hypothetical protein